MWPWENFKLRIWLAFYFYWTVMASVKALTNDFTQNHIWPMPTGTPWLVPNYTRKNGPLQVWVPTRLTPTVNTRSPALQCGDAHRDTHGAHQRRSVLQEGTILRALAHSWPSVCSLYSQKVDLTGDQTLDSHFLSSALAKVRGQSDFPSPPALLRQPKDFFLIWKVQNFHCNTVFNILFFF